MAKTYAQAGVDIERGDRFARFVAGLNSPAVSGSLGGFSGGIEPDLSGMKHPVLLSSTDGVGTKILVARELKDYSTIGIDLVAMCVNDLAVCGAAPAVFLDYIACGKIDEPVLQSVITGIVRGCEEAECTLAGGETAEMPGMYGETDIDLAGFCSGFVDRDAMLPRKEQISEGDIIFGIPSSGIHSNGLSLARSIVPVSDTSAYRKLLTPTVIYVRPMKKLAGTGLVLAAAHITGGGLPGNIARVLPDGLYADLHYRWDIPDIFAYLQRKGRVEDAEMKQVFNMGVGLAMIARAEQGSALTAAAAEHGITLMEIGQVCRG